MKQSRKDDCLTRLQDQVSFPDWAGFTPEFAAAELPRLLDAAEKAVAAIETAEPKAYEDFVWPLDDATRGLWRCWGMVSHMLAVMNSESWRKVEEDWQPKIVAFSLRVGQSRRLYEIAKGLLGSFRVGLESRRVDAGANPNETKGSKDPADATDSKDPVGATDSKGPAGAADSKDPIATRRRILEKMVQSAELAGVGLEGAEKERFNAIQMNLAKLGADFHNAVLDATAAFKYEKDGKTYTIDDANYPETMRECADREVRERLYRARVARAPENEPRIAEILKLRQEEAAILGFANYAEKSLATKCAPSVAAVLKMIDDLDAATVAKARQDEDELLSSSQTISQSNNHTISPWDLAYAAERLREKKYAYSEEELKKHFELEDVVKGLFRMAKFLFDVDVEEVADKPSVWHEDVRFFAVTEKGETIANFYFDPFVRSGLKSGGAWMNEIRNRSEVKVEGEGERRTLPLAVVVTNFPEKDEKGECHLPFREVETLFHEFGHALQCMLTRVGEEDAAGINLVEWDAVEVASQFMENWCLDDRTGIQVPVELKAKVRAAKNFRAATACRRQLAFAKTDLVLHSTAIDGNRQPLAADETKKQIFAHFGLQMIPEDRFLCAFTHIFAGGYAAGYYGYKWAEVMSADCYGAFEEAGLGDDEAVRRLGARYRETVLALGGSKSALDVFRDFRGRDPEVTALLRQQNLI